VKFVKHFAESRFFLSDSQPWLAAFSFSLSQQAFPGIPKQQLKLHLLPYQYSANFCLVYRIAFLSGSTNWKRKK
jgi:hypothetical protein